MPHYEGIEERYQPTKVHLQVYDGEPDFSCCPFCPEYPAQLIGRCLSRSPLVQHVPLCSRSLPCRQHIRTTRYAFSIEWIALLGLE